MQDQIKGAIGAGGSGDASGTATMSAQRGMNVALSVLRDENQSMREELGKLRPLAKEKVKSEHAAYLDAEAKKLGITLSAAHRD